VLNDFLLICFLFLFIYIVNFALVTTQQDGGINFMTVYIDSLT